jgi:5-methyltetrahydropteroyltriglutamate--homocysteine methyltransferase
MADRILTTHAGSLPRPQAVADVLFAQERGEAVDPAQAEAVFAAATDAAVARQAAIGMALPSDGEMSKISYATYVKDRLTGFDGDSPRRTPADLKRFPAFMERLRASGGTPTYRRPMCVGPVAVKDLRPLHADIARFGAALARHGYGQAFMNSATPGVIALFQPSSHHPSHEAYLAEVAEAMREEYEAIVAAGFILQLDAPDLCLGRHMQFPDASDAEFLRVAELHVEVLNHALRNIPADRVRMHVCWGNYEGPHVCDIDLAAVLPVVLKAKPRCLSFEASNPRHAHEWTVWRETAIPDDYVLLPGCIDTTTNFVEHPLLVAERIERFAAIVGRDRVIAGADCGLATFAGFGAVDPEIAWAKLESLTRGAAIATERLWGRAA